MTKKRVSKPVPIPKTGIEFDAYLASLRKHQRVIEGEDCAAKDLPPGVTHILVNPLEGAPKLVEKRKSFI